MMNDNNFCSDHALIREMLEDLKKMNPLSSKTALTLFGIFIVVAMAVIGFLWQGQSSIWNKEDLNHKETMKAIQQVSDKVLVIDYKVQTHLDESREMKKQK